MRSTMGKIVMAVLALFLVAYIGYQAVDYFYKPYRLETVYKYTFQDSVTGNAVFIREEKQVESEISGVLDYIHNDSEMVSKGMAIAEIYPSSQDILNLERIAELQAEIKMLEDSEKTEENYLSVFETIGTQISDALENIVVDMRMGDVSATAEGKNELMTLINRRQIIAGIEENYDSRISQLKMEIDRLSAQTASAQGFVYAKEKGYFSSAADGYEYAVTPEKMAEMTAEDYKKIIEGKGAQQLTSRVVGKLITDYNWYCAVVISAEEAGRFSIGDSLNIMIDDIGTDFIPVKVENVVTVEESQEAVVILKCGYMNDQLANLRTAEVEITFGAVSGLRIPNSAIRMVGGIKGVYVLKKQTVKYRPIEVIYERNGFVVVRMNEEDASSLQQFDELFVEGNDLYEGKHID